MSLSHDRDGLTRFLLERSGVRGVLVRLNDTWDSIRGRADYPADVAGVLGETCAASALFTGNAKVKGRLSIQLRGTTGLGTVFAECGHDGRMRGIARHETHLPEPLVPRNFGDGAMLAITIENPLPGTREPVRYQGLVGLDADTLAGAFEVYFQQSEQLPTRVILASSEGGAAGLMLQMLPGGEGDPDGWNRSCALFDTLGADELLRLPVETLLWRLFHEEEVRLLGGHGLHFGCTCSRERVADVLRSLGQEEAMAAAQADGVAEVTCEFCNSRYTFDRVDIAQLFSPADGEAPPRPQ